MPDQSKLPSTRSRQSQKTYALDLPLPKKSETLATTVLLLQGKTCEVGRHSTTASPWGTLCAGIIQPKLQPHRASNLPCSVAMSPSLQLRSLTRFKHDRIGDPSLPQPLPTK